MSPVHTLAPPKTNLKEKKLGADSLNLGQHSDSTHLQSALEQVGARIAPVWPLKDYVAVNPYAGLADEKFLAAKNSLQAVSDLEMLMPMNYYRQEFDAGTFSKTDIDAAVDELVADGVSGAERIDVNQVVSFLSEQWSPSPTADARFAKVSRRQRALFTFAELFDRQNSSNWSRLVEDETSKHCAAHYDQGQAVWRSRQQELSLYAAWHSVAKHDRSFGIRGVASFRKLVSRLPRDPHEALVALLNHLGVPTEMWSDFLLCEALTMPGWGAWTRYQKQEAEKNGEENDDFAGLLAIRLSYQVALSIQFDFQVDWLSIWERYSSLVEQTKQPNDQDLLRYAILKASEIAFRKRVLERLTIERDRSTQSKFQKRSLAQMVFCIDVRSERIRRKLEATSNEIETFGFAGFFGLPIEFVELGAEDGSSQVPVLISPQFKVHEEVDHADKHAKSETIKRRATIRFFRKAWADFQKSAVSSFAFVETTGLFYGLKLIARTLRVGGTSKKQFDAVSKADRHRLSPSLCGLDQLGIDSSKQAEMAESILRGIGIIRDFGRFVVLCGHGSQVENNPLKAGLDCGACGGHSGEPNARFAAKLLNQRSVRRRLAKRGIVIPNDTYFLAASHNTTTDEIEFFDTHNVPASHRGDLDELNAFARSASAKTRKERLAVLPGPDTGDLIRRSQDWSEVRPEWGLAGNATFIAAPRKMTSSSSLSGRAFLHSYDYNNDPEFAVLEQIMTAPMVVANWINMQYYASTVDPIHFGSGNKTVHNVVGRFGIFSGNGGDLRTGLPWQSVHDGKQFQHHPLRLLVIIAAPRQAVHSIIAKHPNIASLITNGWVQLTTIEDGNYYRFTEQQDWEEIANGSFQSVKS